jgi:hypothetical protein
MLEKHDNRRQRGTRPNGVEFQISEQGMNQGTGKDAKETAKDGKDWHGSRRACSARAQPQGGTQE